MTKAILPLPAFSAVAAGQNASVSIPVTNPYSAIYLQLSSTVDATATAMSKADMATHIERIKLKIALSGNGSKTFWDITGAQLIILNDFYGLPAETGILPLYFARPYFNSAASEDNFALGTLNVTSCILEVQFSGTVVAPVITAHAEAYTGANVNLGQFIRLDTNQYSAAAAAGVREISDLPIIGPGLGLKALHINTDEISQIELKVNQADFRQQVNAIAKTAENAASFRTGGRTWQSGFTHMDLAGNRLGNIFPTQGIRDFRLKLTMTDAVAFQILTETVVVGA